MNFFSGSNNFLTQKVFRPKKNFYPTSVQVLHQHEITKGFRLIKKGESPLLFLHSLLRRFPSNMKAKKRVIIYDFACKMHRCALFRFCHSPNSTSTQPQLNSTELGLTRKWLCTPPPPTTTTHPTTQPPQTQLPQINLWCCLNNNINIRDNNNKKNNSNSNNNINNNNRTKQHQNNLLWSHRN